MFFPRTLVKETEVAEAVKEAERELAPDVIRIRFNVGEDWMGDPSLFFRVVLSDKASRPMKRLGRVADRVEKRLRDDPRVAGTGLFSYFDFRNKSEQAALKEKAWS